MPRTKTKPPKNPDNGTSPSGVLPSTTLGAVLTLAETAHFLRLSEPEVLRLVHHRGLPGRSVGDDWRFLKAAIEQWLGTVPSPEANTFWKTHFGALRDDPFLEEMLHGIYDRRKRPEVEDS
jgi:excisionase family DNA binding protein